MVDKAKVTTTVKIDVEITSVRYVKAVDPDPDLSWLEQECFNDATDTEPADYGKRRIEAYRQGEWWAVGIYAEALTRDETVIARSGGVWGIESDSDDAHFNEVASDERSELSSSLGLGVDGLDSVRTDWVELDV